MSAPYPPVVRLLARLLGCAPAESLVAGAAVHFAYRPAWRDQQGVRVLGVAPSFPESLWRRLGVPFERHTAAELRLAALLREPPRDRHLLVLAPEGLLHVRAWGTTHVTVDDGETVHSAVPEQVEARWARAVPPGIWYAVSRRRVRPSERTLWDGLLHNAHDMLVSSGAPQGVDGIELWGEALATWPEDLAWPAGAAATAAHIRETGSLWRQALAQALEALAPRLPVALRPAPLLAACVELWEEVADKLAQAAAREDADALVAARSRVLRLAGAESRLWSHIAEHARRALFDDQR